MDRHNFFAAFACSVLLLTGYSGVGQTLYTEDFEDENPDQENLCFEGSEYSPADANWDVGSVCVESESTTVRLTPHEGSTWLEWNDGSSDSFLAWSSDDFDVSNIDLLAISFDVMSHGSMDVNVGDNVKDMLQFFLVLDGVEVLLWEVTGHVDGSDEGFWDNDEYVSVSVDESYSLSGVSSASLVLYARVTGADESYFLDNVEVSQPGPCDEEIVFEPALSDESVACLDELPTECDGGQGASRGVVSCGLAEDVQARTVCAGTTAEGVGDDGALILYDIEGDTDDDRYFVPTDMGLTLTQFENGVAVVSGQVVDVADATAILNVNVFYDNGTSGADWTGSFKSDISCGIPPAGNEQTDEWTLYELNSSMSFLTGEGSLDGTTLQLGHMSGFGFQVGEGANDRNCNYGAGGWLSYTGHWNGSPVAGAMGDLLLDLDCVEETNNSCGEDESTVTMYYTAYDADCGDVIFGTETFTRHDTEAPTFDNAPADIFVSCEDMDIEVPTVTASDNCEDSDATGPTVTYNGQSPQYDITCTGSYKVDRTWTAEDCSGNQVGHTQTITVYDNLAPVINGGIDYDAECDGSGNTDELQVWLDSHGTATATDNCGEVSWTHDYEDGDMSDGCGATGTVDVVFTASDDCGNSDSITLTFTIEDTTAPDLTATPTHDIACEEYSSDGIYGASSSDVCGDSEVVLVSVSEVSSNCAGVYLHTYMAVDDCENESEPYEQVVTLIDTDAPEVTIWYCPVDANLSTDENCEADTTPEANGIAMASAEDNCDDAPEVIVEYSDAVTPGCTGSYTIERTWTATATDHCDNVASTSCTQIITVTDDTNPVPSISCPIAYTVDADENCDADTTPSAAGEATATATDNCSPEDNISIDITYEDSEAISDCDGQYSFVRTWTALATDDCGNEASTSCTQTITVEDNTAPTWDAYDTYAYAACEDLLDPTDPTLVPISASDNCSEVSYSIEAYQLSGGCPGTWMRVWTATDDCGNASVETEQYVQLYDNIKPVPEIVCPEDYTIDADGDCEADTTPSAAGEATATATDNCAAEEDITIEITYEDGPITDVCTGAYHFTRTWTATATDECDNVDSISCDQLITVEDNTAPVITGGAGETVECDGSGNLDELNAWLANNGGATATDNCSEITWSHDYEDGDMSDDCAATGSVDVIFTATDDCGNFSSTSVFTFEIEDTTAPVISGNMEESVSCDAWTCDAEALEEMGLFSVAEDCGDYTLDITCNEGSGGCVQPIPEYTITIVATDECGNVSEEFMQIITLVDDVSPTIDEEAVDQTVQCDGSGNTAALTAWLDSNGGASASDACSSVTWDNDFVGLSDDCGATGSATVTFTATDDCGNTSETTATFTIEDTTDPSMDTASSNETVQCDGSGNTAALTAWLDSNGGASASDACGGVTWDNDFDGLSDDCGATGSATVTFTATDACGNTSETTATFTIEDTTDPSIDTASSNETVQCDGSGNTAALTAWLDSNGGASASDACGGVTWDNDFDGLSDDCGATGSATVTFTATDACGNTSETTATFTIEDTTDPSMDTASSNETVQCDGSGNTAALTAWLDSNGGASASDACGGVTWDNDFDGLSDDCGATGSATVTFTATDDCGNTSETTATFTIEDTTDPSIDTASSNETVQCDGSGNTAALTAWLDSNGGASASDACGGVTWDNDFDGLSDDCGATGSATVTFTATDACGNTSETTATFTIEDTTDPSIDTASSNETVQCDGSGNTAALTAWLDSNGGASASDACGGVTWDNDFDGLSDDCGATGSATVTFTATDACGNTSETTATFTIEDTTDPSMDTASSNETVQCDGSGNTAALTAWLDSNGGASASDACGGVTWDNDFDGLSDDCGATGSATVTFTATDACGNTSETTATFTIEDTTDPSMDTASSNETVQCDGSGNTAALTAWLDSNGGASASDACGGVTWDNDFDGLSDDCGATGSATVTFTATDACGNFSETSATFTIEDTTIPAASADAETEVACDEYDATEPYGNFTASDACSEVTVEITDMAVSGACAGSYSRTYTITDECGNDTLVYQIINLTDDVAPSFDIACPDNVDLVADGDCNADTSVETHGSATFSNVMDNCDDEVDMEVSSSDEIAYGCQGSYTISRTWTITGTDHCDNTTEKTCVQTITVSDETAPTISGGANALVECDGSGNTDELNAWLADNGGATATDNCSAVSWSHSDATLSDACGATGTVDVVFTATDECNNSASITLTFTIQDTTPPSLSIEGPANQNLDQNATCDVDTSIEALGNVSASADDACGSASIEITHEDGMATYTCAGDDEALEGSYTFVRTFTVTATDECGLHTTDTYEQTITVTDGIAPQFTETCGLANGDVQDVCCEDLSGTVTIPDACETAASDNCDSDVAIASSETYVGEYAPTEEVMSFCLSTTPAAYADGEACNGLDPHAFSLFNFDGQPRVDFTSVGSGLVSQMNDGTWMLEQELANEAGTGTLTLTVTYGAASSWDDWFVPGQTNYKRDCGVLVDDHENWDYRILESGSVMGSGDYDGLDLSLSHAPANEYYAFQIGLGANNQNDNYGYSGWIMATGTYGDDAVFFSGDLFGDLDCCLPWSIDREYTASDDCGNATEFAYSISVNGDDCGDDDGALVSGGQDEDHTPGIIGGAGDVLTGKSPIRVTNLQPNPTNDLSLLGFTVTQNMRLRVDMYTMDGILVSELYDGIVSPNVNHTLDIEANALESGMYQIRLSSSQYLVVKKLLVTE